MAAVNYSNPASFLPSTTPMQPPAFLQGMQYNKQNTDYDNAVALSHLLNQMAVAKESEDMTLGTPVRASERLSNIATNRANTATIGQLKRGQAASADAAGRLAMGTVDSDITTKIAKNAVDQGQAGINQIQNAMRFGMMISQLQGPQAAAQIQQLGSQFKVDPNIIRMAQQNPQKTMEFLTSINEKVAEFTATKIPEQKLQNQGLMDVAVQHGKDQRAVAGINASAMRDRLNAGQDKMSTDQRLSYYTNEAMKYQNASQPIPPQLLQIIKELRQQRIDERTAGIQQGQAQTANIIPSMGTPAPVQAQPFGVPPTNPISMIAPKFAADPAMKGKTLGKFVPNKGVEVLDNGKLIGYYN